MRIELPIGYETSQPVRRINRRGALKWMLAAAAAAPFLGRLRADTPADRTSRGYGPDPDLLKTCRPGEYWPLTFTPGQRRTVAVLCDTIIPADGESPAASAVGVVDFLDEWISAPYPEHVGDRAQILAGLAWLDGESRRRFERDFAGAGDDQRRAICDDICYFPKARPEFAVPAKFFARFRDLAAGGFYTSPEGTKDLKYIGNIPMATFEGPPPEVLKHVGLL